MRHGAPMDALEVQDIPVPDPGPGEVRIAVSAASLNFGDIARCRGTVASEEQDNLARAFAKRLGAAPDALEPRIMAAAIGGALWTVFERWVEGKSRRASA